MLSNFSEGGRSLYLSVVQRSQRRMFLRGGKDPRKGCRNGDLGDVPVFELTFKLIHRAEEGEEI